MKKLLLFLVPAVLITLSLTGCNPGSRFDKLDSETCEQLMADYFSIQTTMMETSYGVTDATAYVMEPASLQALNTLRNTFKPLNRAATYTWTDVGNGWYECQPTDYITVRVRRSGGKTEFQVDTTIVIVVAIDVRFEGYLTYVAGQPANGSFDVTFKQQDTSIVKGFGMDFTNIVYNTEYGIYTGTYDYFLTDSEHINPNTSEPNPLDDFHFAQVATIIDSDDVGPYLHLTGSFDNPDAEPVGLTLGIDHKYYF